MKFYRLFHHRKIDAALKILLITNAMVLLAGFMLGPIYALFVTDIGGDILDAGWAWAIYAMAAGVTVYILSKVENKHKHKEKFLVAGYLIMATGFFGYIFVHSIFTLFLVQIIIGLGEAMYIPVYDGLYSKHLSRGNKTYEWGIWESMNYIVTGVGAIIGATIAKVSGFESLFIFMGCLSLLAAVFIMLTPRKILN
ncbi:MFS transporter [Patescibacteria group bacterium]